MIVLKIIAIWFLISIIFSLFLGSFLSLTNPSKDEIKMANHLETEDTKNFPIVA
jgi:hypothetical protein